jgi:hypothetical protein
MVLQNSKHPNTTQSSARLNSLVEMTKLGYQQRKEETHNDRTAN